MYAKQVAEHELKRRQETWSAYGVQQRGLATAEFSYAVAAINPQRENALKTAQLNSDLTYDHAKLSAMNSVARMDAHIKFVGRLPPESFVSVGISIFEPQALWEVSGEAFMQWVEHGDLLDTTSDGFAGFGDTLTLGGTAKLREWMGTDQFVDRTSFAYTAGAISGMVVSTIITSGAGVPCGTGSWALQLAQGYTKITNLIQFGIASYNIYSGHGSWMDVLTIALTVAGIKYLRGGCFVGDTLIVLDDGRRLPLCGEVIADASTSSSFVGWQSAGMLTVLTVGVLGVVVAEDIRRREREEEARRARQLITPAWPPDPDPDADADDEEEEEWLEALAHEHATEDIAWRESDDWLGADRECGFWDRTDDQAGSLAVVALPKLTRTIARERSAPPPQSASRASNVAASALTTAATAKSAARSSSRTWGVLWLLLCLGICGAWKGTNWLLTPSKDLSTIGREVEQPPLVTQKINEVPVGQWVLAENPELADEDFDPYEDLDPSQWHKLVLAMEKADGSRLDIDLLRPLEWLEEYGAVVGQTIDLDLPELGAAGTATVVAIEPCPALAPRPSERHHLVTGKFRHQVDELIDLHIEGLDEPITCTPNHLFWSEDRQEFVPAGELWAREQLSTAQNERMGSVRSERRDVPGSLVYNLEVGETHTYFVSSSGILVHNICPGSIVPETAHMSDAAKAFQKTQTAISVTWKIKPDPRMRNVIKFDAWDEEAQVLIDRKLNVTTFPKSIKQAQNQVKAAQQHGVTVRWEVPHKRVEAAKNLLKKAGITGLIDIVGVDM